MSEKLSKMILPIKSGNTTTNKEFEFPSGSGGSAVVYDDTLPYGFYKGSAVVLNDEIHILGSNGSKTKHYKWTGTSWVSVSTLPYNFYGGSAVVFNGEIHILGGVTNETSHYKWNGSSWVSVSTLPDDFGNGSAVVFNNEIHILGGVVTFHYKWDGTSWTEASTLPDEFYNGSAVIFNNEIYILGGDINETKHYKWNGSSWTEASTLPYSLVSGSAIVLDDEIHILGGSNNRTAHYKWNGSSWIEASTLPYNFYQGSAVVLNGEIHILGGYGYTTKHYRWNDASWTNEFNIHNLDDRYVSIAANQGLTDEEKANARSNIGAGDGKSLSWNSWTVMASDWSSETVNDLGDGNDYYYYEIELLEINAESPRIELIPISSSGNTIPTAAEVSAFNCITKPNGWAVCDSTNMTLTLYAKTKPTTNFRISIQGVYISYEISF